MHESDGGLNASGRPSPAPRAQPWPSTPRWIGSTSGLILFLLISPSSATAQEGPDLRREIQESQLRLEQVRQERAQLRREMDGIRSRVQNVSGELRNIERQLSASHSVLAEIDFQVAATSEQVQLTTGSLLRTRDELRERQAVLNRRLRSIYKRGPLHTTEVLLGAESFSDLLNRYRYLQLIATYDRALFQNIRQLEQELAQQNRELQESLSELGRLRESQLGEVAELRGVEEEHQRTLEQFQGRERETFGRIDELEADEQRLAGVVTDLERRRLEDERRRAVEGRAAPPPNTLSVADLGSLNWPVEGDLAYGFGLEERPSGTFLRWSGVGIRAPVGTPVRAVRAGAAVLAGSFEGYGPSVILSHGHGYYTLYLYLDEVGVVEGRTVESGQVVGTVGGASTPEGPRVEFQVRAPVDGSAPQAVDPLRWLRPQPGTR